MNDLDKIVDCFSGIQPYRGTPAPGFYPNWAGAMTDIEFRKFAGHAGEVVGGAYVETAFPDIRYGDTYLEEVNWVEAAKEASGHYVMMSLGACYGAQNVGAYKTLQLVNPLPCTLVAVDPEPENVEWIRAHFRNNGLDPDDHWILSSAISNNNDPVFFPVGAPGSGGGNCIATNNEGARAQYVSALLAERDQEKVIENLLLNNSTGLNRRLVPGLDVDFEIKLVSAVTLRDLLAPFKRVDYMEVDIQQSEVIAFPPFMDIVRSKVRRVHLGTHGRDTHDLLAHLFRRDNWEILFDFAPDSLHETRFGSFMTGDGVLTVLNPNLHRI